MNYKFNATNEQLVKVFENAINASTPRGLGNLHYQPKDYELSIDDIRKTEDDFGYVSFDYFEGRMVKLSIKCNEVESEDEVRSYCIYGEPTEDYQSFLTKYPTYLDLLIESGVAAITLSLDKDDQTNSYFKKKYLSLYDALLDPKSGGMVIVSR